MRLEVYETFLTIDEGGALVDFTAQIDGCEHYGTWYPNATRCSLHGDNEGIDVSLLQNKLDTYFFETFDGLEIQ